MPSEKVLILTDLNFETEVIQSAIPVLVDFSAAWCGPCRALATVIDQLANELEGVKIGKLDIDEAPKTAERYGVRGVPTIMVFKGGVVTAQHTGLVPLKRLIELVNASNP